MSMSILWPSLLTTIGGDSVFWLPTLNDNMRLLDDVLSPAAALLPVSGAVRPNRVVSWDALETGQYVVCQGPGRGIAGVAVGHPRTSGDVLTKLYGGAVVETSHNISLADVGSLAVLEADGRVHLTTSPPAEYDSWVGLVIGVSRARHARIIMRYYGNYASQGIGCVYTRSAARPNAPIGGGVLIPDVDVGPAGYAESHVFFTYLGSYDGDHPELYNTAVVGVNTGGDVANFQVSSGFLVQGSSGAELTLHLERPYATAAGQASILDAAEAGGTGVSVACDVSGQLVKLTLGSGTWQGQGTRQLMVSVSGILAEG